MVRSFLAASLLLFAAPSLARELNGVKMPDTLSAAGKELKLNGMGLRTKMVFKVYVAGLYLENTAKDAAEVISSDQVKRVEMTMLRDLDKKTIMSAIREGFEANNNKDRMASLRPHLDRIERELPDLKEGQKFTVTYAPGRGTIVSGAGTEVTIEGKEFADAMFSVWLGRRPVDDGLKKGMLGG